MNGSPSRPRRQGFTLVELLVVLVIIITLAGLVTAAIQMLKENAKKRKATTYALSMLNALKSYKAVYGKWPLQSQTEIDTIYDGTNQIAILAALTNNPRRVALIEVQPDAVISNAYSDPWRKPFVVVMDENNDGFVTMDIKQDSTRYETNIKASAIVFSWGPDAKDPDNYIKAW